MVCLIILYQFLCSLPVRLTKPVTRYMPDNMMTREKKTGNASQVCSFFRAISEKKRNLLIFSCSVLDSIVRNPHLSFRTVTMGRSRGTFAGATGLLFEFHHGAESPV